jgi:predicted site-specific integrase-resolvase
LLKASTNRNGKTYLPVAELAQEFGYAIDHISRLCRQGKIDAFQEQNGHWCATRESVVNYRDSAGRIKKALP